MAKKMSLKDFHGGAIPSDIPLPSAPGVTVRPLNHVGLDRHTSWANSMGRQDHRLSPGSAGAVRTYDDKTPFLTHNVQIGRKFDEDERKPLDGGSAPRRTVSDENIHGVVPVRLEVKIDYPSAGNMQTRPATTPVSQFSGGASSGTGGGSYAARFSEAANVTGTGGDSYAARFSEAANVSSGRSYVNGPSPNAWGPRKGAVGILEPAAASWSAPDAANKLAHASALEKVTSGRWLSNQKKQIDVEVIRHPEPEAKVQTKGNTYTTFSYGSVDVNDSSLSRHVGRSLAINDGVQVQVQPPYNGGSELHLSAPSDLTERPKLKLLPRSKPVEIMEPLVAYTQNTPQLGEPVMVEIGNEAYGNVNSTVHGVAGADDDHQAFERPRVNLKPRSQPLEPMERITERERNSLFGGARPRELVLKERGVDDVVVNHDVIHSPNRLKKEIHRAENPPTHQTTTPRQNGKPEPLDHHRTGKTIAEKLDAQRRTNWRNDNRKSSRDLEQQPTQERPPSPETWRKPVEPTPAAGSRYGKASSAVDLALSFSKSVSDPKVATDHFPNQRGVPGQVQIPFSRLTSQPSTRSQINGH